MELGLMLFRVGVKMEFEWELRLELVSNPPGTMFSGGVGGGGRVPPPPSTHPHTQSGGKS